MPPLLTQFALSPSNLTTLAPCMDSDGGEDEEAEWRNNLLSARTVVYQSGVIARQGDSVRHAVDPEELAMAAKHREPRGLLSRPTRTRGDSGTGGRWSRAERPRGRPKAAPLCPRLPS
jgi:hypothetical protein